MYSVRNLAAVNAAATAMTYREHGYQVAIHCTDGMPAVQTPPMASELTQSLAQLTGTIAEALAMQIIEAHSHRPQQHFSEYFAAASYASMQATPSPQGLGSPAIIDKIKNRIFTQYSAVHALAEQILDSIADLQAVAA